MIDRSANDGVTLGKPWRRADTPNDLGTADTFTDSPRGGDHKVVPGAKYKYRVFPVFIVTGPDAYGAPGIDRREFTRSGSSDRRARNSEGESADGQHACLVT